MNCRDVQTRLVAHLDAELAPSEHHQLAAHLGRCAVCAARASHLQLVRPEDVLIVHPTMISTLCRVVDLQAIEVLATASPSHRASTSWSTWLHESTPVRRVTITACAIALVFAMAWGTARPTTLPVGPLGQVAGALLPARIYPPPARENQPETPAQHDPKTIP